MKNIFLGFFLIALVHSFPQSLRGLVNEGVDLFEEGNYAEAEVNFKKGIEQESQNLNANYNLGASLYKQDRFDESVQSYLNALATAENKEVKGEAFYNIGNALLKKGELDKAIEAYKESLKLNPNDQEAKYNLSYALNQKKNQDQQQNQDQQNQDNKDDQKDKNNENDRQNKDQQQNQDQQNKDQNKDDNKKSEKDKQDSKNQSQPERKKNQLSKEEAEQILRALKNNEAQLQKDLRKHAGAKTKSEKDW